MKRIAATLTFIGMLTLCSPAGAYEVKPAQPEPDMLEVNLFLTAQFPTYPDTPPMTARAFHTPIRYMRADRGKAIVRGEDIPRMIFSTDDSPGGLEALTVYIDSIPGTEAVLDWTSFPAVTLSPLELRIRAYDKIASALAPRDTPIIDIILSDLRLSTAEACVEGLCTAGYLDAEQLEAQLVFSTVLPESGYPPFDKWLAGEPVLGELRMQLPNPFAKK